MVDIAAGVQGAGLKNSATQKGRSFAERRDRLGLCSVAGEATRARKQPASMILNLGANEESYSANLSKVRDAKLASMRLLVATASAEDRQLTAKENNDFDALDREVAAIDVKLGKDDGVEAFRSKMNATTQPPMPDINAHLAPSEKTGEVWTDHEGRKVSVLAKGDSLAAAMRRRGERPSPYNLGHIVQHLAGVPLPSDLRMAMGEGSSGDGGYLVNPALSAEVIDLVRAKSRVFEAGARTIEMPQATLYMARLTQDCQTTWHGEGVSDLLVNGAKFDRVTFLAKTLGSVILLSKELVQDAPNVGEVVTQSLAKAFALEVDRAALLGDGSSNSPTGLAHISGVGSTAGAALTDYSEFVASIGRMMANSTFPTAFITSPQVRIKAEGLQDTLHQPLRKPDIMTNVPILDTAKVPYTGSPNTSSVYAGDWTQMMIGVRAQFELKTLKERFVEYGQIGLAAWFRCDVQIAHTAGFDIITGVS